MWITNKNDLLNKCLIQYLLTRVSEGRGAESVSFDDELFGDFSEVGYHDWDVTLGDVVFCGEVMIFRNWGSPALQEEGNPNKANIFPLHDCANPSPPFSG